MRFGLGLQGILVVSTLVASEPRSSPGTLEDIYGPTGDSFQAALGFRVFEGDDWIQPARSYGLGVDDMLIQWREYKLVEDATDCGSSGSCALVVAGQSRVYGGSGVLEVTILDESPYGASAPFDRNDCDGNGSYTDPVDDTDCDDDGVGDVLFVATSVAEPAGKTFVADRTAPGVYEAEIPLSSTASANGVLRVQDGGFESPEVTIRYEDRWDGTAFGGRCGNSPDPTQQGFVVAAVEVLLVTAGVTVISHRIEEVSGDLDGYPDTNETFDLYLTVKNGTSISLTNVVVQVSSTDPKIDCVLQPMAIIPVVDPKGTPGAFRETPDPIRLRVASTADRGGVAPPVACTAGVCTNGAGSCTTAANCVRTLVDSYAARLDVALAADQFDASDPAQSVEVELDLDVTGPTVATSTFVEGFESGLGNFELQNLDAGIASNSASNGARCQYNDPDYPYSNSYGDTECYLGFIAGQNPLNDWHVHLTTSPDGGRAYLGTRSLHYGRHTAGSPSHATLGLSQLDAVRTKAIGLAARVCPNDPAPDKRACNTAADCAGVGGGPCTSASPSFSFKHQVSFPDSRGNSISYGHTIGRGVLHTRIEGASIWQKLYPYENVYDVQGTDEFSNCLFDPTDDGNTEDSYFDPTDPYRRLGPSSTCYPEFVFGYLGDTDEPFAPHRIGRASDGPGLAGSLGIGTWVESKVDLSRFRGRSVRLRFLATTLKISDLTDFQQVFMWNPAPWDDGWYVDDVRVTQTLGVVFPTVTADTNPNAALPACGAAPCSSVTASLVLDPPSGSLPGRTVTLSALGSFADRCTGGTLLFRFFEDADGSGTFSPDDTELAPFGVSPLRVEAPTVTTSYGVTVRCSEGGSGNCAGADATATFSLACFPPPEVFDPELWWARGVRWTSRTRLVVPPFGQIVDLVRGDLGTLRSTGTFTGSAPVCLADGSPATRFTEATNPAAGAGFYYLLRGQEYCNENLSYRTYSPRENPSDPAKRDTEILVCPP